MESLRLLQWAVHSLHFREIHDRGDIGFICQADERRSTPTSRNGKTFVAPVDDSQYGYIFTPGQLTKELRAQSRCDYAYYVVHSTRPSSRTCLKENLSQNSTRASSCVCVCVCVCAERERERERERDCLID